MFADTVRERGAFAKADHLKGGGRHDVRVWCADINMWLRPWIVTLRECEDRPERCLSIEIIDRSRAPNFDFNVGEVRSAGSEYTLQGSLADHWSSLFTYSYAQADVVVGASSASSFNAQYTAAAQLLPGGSRYVSNLRVLYKSSDDGQTTLSAFINLTPRIALLDLSKVCGNSN